MSTPKFTVGMARKFGRRPAREPFPFDEILPLALKNTVSGKGERSSDVACLSEMSVFFACLSKHEFNQALCSKEIADFQSCFKNFQMKKVELSKLKEDDLVAGEKRMHYKKLNKLLSRFPQPV